MIIPGILEKNLKDIQYKISLVDEVAPVVQIDFADGKLVDGKTFLEIKKLSEIQTKSKFDIHLMVQNPLEFMGEKINNCVKICSQIEALDGKSANDFIKEAKRWGACVGLSINPETPLDRLDPYVKRLDFVQFMTIEPGGQGRSFKPEVLEKIKEFRQKYPEINIQNDGGTDETNILDLKNAGVDDFVAGSVIFKSSNPVQKYLQLENMLKNSDKINSISGQVSADKPEKVDQIAILGGAAWKEGEQPYTDAFDTSKLLAENGFRIVNGGGPGVMRASTKGAHAGGGRVIAVTYHPNKPKRHYEGVDPKNDFDDEVITLDYFDRTKVMLQTTQMHIVFKGSIGTLSEFGMTWVSSWIHEPHNKPIALFGKFWKSYLEEVKKNFLIERGEENMLKICTTPKEVLDFAKSFC